MTATRPEVVDRLRAWSGAVVLAAPLGYGKTALLVEWVHDVDERRPVVWLRVTPDDADPRVFVRSLFRALTRVLDLELPRVSEDADVTGVLFPEALNVLEAITEPFLVVLDEYEQLPQDAAGHAVTRQLLGYRPFAATVVVCGRLPPPFGLARQRATGALLELGADDLALRPDGMDRLVRVVAPELDEHLRGQIVDVSEGWPAGAVLTARASRRRDHDIASVAREEVARYLLEDLAGRLPAAQVDALATLVLLERVEVASLRALAPDQSVRELVDILDREQMLASSNGSGWSLRPAGRHALRRRFDALPDEARTRARRDAGAHLVATGDLDGGIPLLLAAGASTIAEAAIISHGRDLFRDPERAVSLRGWLSQLPEERLDERVDLSVLAAWVALPLAPPGEVRQRLRVLQDHVQRDGEAADLTGSVEAHHAVIRARFALHVDGNVGAALAAARRGAAEPWSLPLHSTTANSVLATTLALAGDLPEARRIAQRTIGLAFEGESPLGRAELHAVLALVPDEDGGDWQEHVDVVLGLHRELGATRFAAAMLSTMSCGVLLARGGRTVDAEALLAVGREIIDRDRDRPAMFMRRLLELELGRRAGDSVAGLLAAARLELEDWTDPGVLPRLLNRFAVAVDAVEGGEELTDRELEVLRELAGGGTRGDVAERLFVSLDTVKSHLGAVYRKLGVTGRGEAVRHARRLGLLDERGEPRQ